MVRVLLLYYINTKYYFSQAKGFQHTPIQGVDKC